MCGGSIYIYSGEQQSKSIIIQEFDYSTITTLISYCLRHPIQYMMSFFIFIQYTERRGEEEKCWDDEGKNIFPSEFLIFTGYVVVHASKIWMEMIFVMM